MREALTHHALLDRTLLKVNVFVGATLRVLSPEFSVSLIHSPILGRFVDPFAVESQPVQSMRRRSHAPFIDWSSRRLVASGAVSVRRDRLPVAGTAPRTPRWPARR